MRCVPTCWQSAPTLRQHTTPAFTTRVPTRKRVPTCHSSAASSLITSPVLTELVRLSLSTSSVTSAKTIAAGSHLATQGGSNLLVQYSILCALLASLGTWILQFAGYIWDSLFEKHIFQESSAPEENSLYGVDVTHSRFFPHPKVQEAVAFAAQAHKGQTRKTREPYVAHCIATACIVEEVLELAEDSAFSNARAECTIIAALLHDVLDDTSVKVQQVEEQFGSEVVHMVAQVSQLSSMNQLLRRRRRQMSGPSRGLSLSHKEEEQLRTFILSMVSEPLVLVVKLADRLHNMRTVFALKKDKQKAVATETLQVWCGLAERLGMMALKAELEDLCFAVLQPVEYMLLRNELDAIWGLQRVTDLVPSQADSLFRQAQSNIKLATETANLDSYPTPHLPPAAPIPRPSLASPTDDVSAASTQAQDRQNGQSGASQQSMQSVQSGSGDLYAHAEHGVTRSPGRAKLNVRQQQALESGLLRLSRPQSNSRGSNTATATREPAIKPVKTVLATPALLAPASRTSSDSSSLAAASSPTVASSAPSAPSASAAATAAATEHEPDHLLQQRISSNSEASSSSSVPPAKPNSAQTPQSAAAPIAVDSSQSESNARLPRGTWFRRDRIIDSFDSKPEAKSEGPKRVVRGRSARKALAAQAAADARAKSGNKSCSRPPEFSFLSPEQQQVQRLVGSVLPFSAMGFKDHRAVPAGAARLEVLQGCARLLLIDIQREGYAAGLKVQVQGRVKSLYSIYRKMVRKDIPMRQVYDARALRVIVDDEGGTRTADAWAAAYRIQPAVHRLWRKVGGEYDDYIINPKRSGYQSLHTAVRGPGGVPIEVQIRTAQMHEQAEYGDAAHWAYKENTPKLVAPGKIQEKQPVVCLTNGRMRYGVVYSITKDGLQFLAVVSSESVMPAADQSSETMDYFLQLHEYAHKHGWFRPGHGDLHASLELYSKCKDGRFRREDHTGYKMPAYCTPLEAWAGQSDSSSQSPAFQQGQPTSPGQPSREQTSGGRNSAAQQQAQGGQPQAQTPPNRQQQAQRDLTQKIRFLRTMLEWRNEVTSNPGFAAPAGAQSLTDPAETSQLGGEVMILIWPAGDFVRLPRGTTAGQIVHDQGWATKSGDECSRLVNVNNRLVAESTVLEDGDYLVFSRELLTI